MKLTKASGCFVALFILTNANTEELYFLSDTSVKYVPQYRVINWCIQGSGERLLYNWPFNQLQHFLRSELPREFNDNFKLKPGKKNDGTSNLEGPTLSDTTVSMEMSGIDCLSSGVNRGRGRAHIKLKFSELVEALVIQAVHAPFGLGFPFGQFQTNEDFKCKDCDYMQGRVVPCLSRPFLESIHPTVGIFHFGEPEPDGSSIKGKKNELHWNFKWVDDECASVGVVEFWLLIILSVDRRIWVTRKLGPYNLTLPPEPYDSSNKNYSAKVPDIPGNVYLCQPYRKPPTVVTRKCKQSEESEECSDQIKRLEKYYLSVDYPPGNVSCHSTTTTKYTPAEENNLTSPIRMEGSFDSNCITGHSLGQPGGKICKEWLMKFKCLKNEPEIQELNKPWPEKINFLNESLKEDRYFPKSSCDRCLNIHSDHTYQDYEEYCRRYKTLFHKILMFTAYLLVAPIGFFLVRFYKETYNEVYSQNCRQWLAAHIAASFLQVILTYGGYVLPFYYEKDIHVILGYISWSLIVLAFLCGWFRSMDFIQLYFSLFLHSFSAYMGWFVGLLSVLVYGQTNLWVKFCICLSFIVELFATIKMSFHIKQVDTKLGMFPIRSMFPIVQIRFVDIQPPGQRFRKKFLMGYSFVISTIWAVVIACEVTFTFI